MKYFKKLSLLKIYKQDFCVQKKYYNFLNVYFLIFLYSVLYIIFCINAFSNEASFLKNQVQHFIQYEEEQGIIKESLLHGNYRSVLKRKGSIIEIEFFTTYTAVEHPITHKIFPLKEKGSKNGIWKMDSNFRFISAEIYRDIPKSINQVLKDYDFVDQQKQWFLWDREIQYLKKGTSDIIVKSYLKNELIQKKVVPYHKNVLHVDTILLELRNFIQKGTKDFEFDVFTSRDNVHAMTFKTFITSNLNEYSKEYNLSKNQRSLFSLKEDAIIYEFELSNWFKKKIFPYKFYAAFEQKYPYKFLAFWGGKPTKFRLLMNLTILENK